MGRLFHPQGSAASVLVLWQRSRCWGDGATILSWLILVNAEEETPTLHELQACSGLCSAAIKYRNVAGTKDCRHRLASYELSEGHTHLYEKVVGISLLKITVFAEVVQSSQGLCKNPSAPLPAGAKVTPFKEKQYAEAAAQLHYFILYIYTKVKWILK